MILNFSTRNTDMDSNKKIELSVILPCFNEVQAIPFVLSEIQGIFKKIGLTSYEIILSDNNSTDASAKIFEQTARELGIFENTQVVHQTKQGYGAAYQKGIQVARGEIYILADVDGSYNFNNLPSFFKKIDEGYELVIGNRFTKNMNEGSMPMLNKFIGNPVLSFLLRMLFDTNIRDVHSGMRVLTKTAYKKLNLYTTGMEYASEMIIQSSRKKIKACEVPIEYRVRKGTSKLKNFRDGLRHIRFMALYSPNYVFIFPGVFLFLLGFIGLFFVFLEPLHTKLTLVSFLGIQFIFFGIFNKFYAITHLGERDSFLEKITPFITIEKVVLTALVFFVLGIILSFFNTKIALIVVLGSILSFFYSLLISITSIKE